MARQLGGTLVSLPMRQQASAQQAAHVGLGLDVDRVFGISRDQVVEDPPGGPVPGLSLVQPAGPLLRERAIVLGRGEVRCVAGYLWPQADDLREAVSRRARWRTEASRSPAIRSALPSHIVELARSRR